MSGVFNVFCQKVNEDNIKYGIIALEYKKTEKY